MKGLSYILPLFIVIEKLSDSLGSSNEREMQALPSCGFPLDGFDYTGCEVNFDCAIGNGMCDRDGNYNTEACNFDGGDCFCENADFPDDGFDYSNCDVRNKCFIADNECHARGAYNTEACNYDGGDCPSPSACKDAPFPDDGFNYENCEVPLNCWIGDGLCNIIDPYNTEACNFDGGDCACQNAPFPDDGFDYTDCSVVSKCFVGDGICQPRGGFNTPECNFDAGDCACNNADFPDDGFDYSQCRAPLKCVIGDGTCNDGSTGRFFFGYNVEKCNFDGGDCAACEAANFPDDDFDYSSCDVKFNCLIGDGVCDHFAPGNYTSEECNFDGGDCLCDFPDDGFDYTGCDVKITCLIGDGFCNTNATGYFGYNTEVCNYDGGDCLID